MSTLIVHLPSQAAGANPVYAYVWTPDGQQAGPTGSTSLPLLPSAQGGDVVAIVPAAVLSWHQVTLPKGTLGSGVPASRVRAVLEGLLEDALLDEPGMLHLALAPDARANGPVWVAACDRAWLRDHLQALESVQRAVSRIVPELAPTSPAGLQVTGDASLPLLAWHSAQGAGVLPLSQANAALARQWGALPVDLPVWATPAVAAVAEDLLGTRVVLQQDAQRWLLSAQGAWDLAQFDLSSSGGRRALKRLEGLWQSLRHAPAWKPVRWGAALLLVTHLVGLNAWAWREKSALQAQRQEVRQLLSQTFPKVSVIVDAPLQMEREVAALRQAAGGVSGRDLEPMLSALGSALPAGKGLKSIDFAGGELRLRGLDLSAEQKEALGTRLQAGAYRVSTEGDSLVVREARP